MNLLWYTKVWLADASMAKIKSDTEDNNIGEKLDKIEKRISRIENMTFPIGLFCSGLPIMAIGFSGLVQNILDKINFETLNSIYYLVGAAMVSIAFILQTKRIKVAISIIGVSLLIFVILRLIIS